MSGNLLLSQRVSDRIMLATAEAAPHFYDYNRDHSAKTEDAVVSVEPPSTPAVDIEVGGMPFHYFAAAEFQSKKWALEFTKSGFRRDHAVFQSEVLHNPPFNPFHCKFSSFTGHSVGIRCSDGLLADVASDLADPVPLAIWAGHTTLDPAPRSAKMICDLGRKVRAGVDGDILFLDERIRNILRMWMIERRKLEPRRPRHCRFTAQGMALIKSTLQVRCLDNPTLAELAAVVGMGVDPFRRAFRGAFCQTPHEYLMDLRLGLVREALTRDERTPLHILAPACGFANAPHLARSFKKRYGWTPQKFRQWTMPGKAAGQNP